MLRRWMTLAALTAAYVAVLPAAPAGSAPPAAQAGPSAAKQTGLTIQARSARLVPGGATVTLTGHYTCGPFPNGTPDRGVIDLTVRQPAGSAEVVGYGYLEPTRCDGTAQRFTATVNTNGTGAYRRGAAQWSASGYVEGGGGLQHVFVPPTAIRIR